MIKLLSNIVKIAIRSIAVNGMRSLLTSIGVIIGVSSVIVLSAIGQGSQTLIENEINNLGTNLLIIFPGSGRTGGVHQGAGTVNRFTMDDVINIRTNSEYCAQVSPVVIANGQIIGNGNNWSSEINGVSQEFFSIRKWEIEYGSFFSERDIKASKKVALIGKTVADELFPDEDPTGKKIQIRNIPFMVVGVLKEKGESEVGRDQDDIVIAPWTTVLYRLKGGRYIDMMNISVNELNNMENAEDELTSILRAAHRLNDNEEDDFTIQSQTEITDTINQTTKIMTLLLGAIASVSLIVGGIGIMNIMLVSVTERTHEIGIRISVGARSNDIMMQFLIEAVVLSVGGGILGIIISYFISFVLNNVFNTYTIIKPNIVLLSFLFSAVVGVFFGYYPAKKAASLNPIDALRYE
jgi:putative ABC transport system permease protein